MKILLEFLAALMVMVGGGYYLALSAPAVMAVTSPAFQPGTAYADVPGTQIDALQQDLETLSFEFICTVFGVTCKIQASNDAVNWVDITSADQVGVARPIDVVVAVGTTIYSILTPNIPAGAAGGAFRYYKTQAKNTVGGSVGTVIVVTIGK
jgi:hypothetical protein